MAASLLMSCVPVNVPGGLKPVMDDPGERQRLPSTTVLPVFVIVVAAHTPYFAAVPNNCASARAARARHPMKEDRTNIMTLIMSMKEV